MPNTSLVLILTKSYQQQEILLEEDLLRKKRVRYQERNHGVWDCGDCTFENPPYRPTCAICQALPPPHILVFSPLTQLRYGVELEIIIPNGKADGFTYESIAQAITNLGIRVDYKGYSHETVDYWKLVTDASVKATDHDLCFELVSPILQGDDGLANLRSLMENVRTLGIDTNSSCGFHVHVDASKGELQAVPSMGTVNGLKRVAKCFVALENAFDLIVASQSGGEQSSNNNHRRANSSRYCGSNRLLLGSLSNRQRWERISNVTTRRELETLLNPNNDRYRKLNLTNITKLDRPSTIEFRHHAGVQQLLEAEAWVRLVLRFCERASSSEQNCQPCLLPECATPKQEVHALFATLQCPGLEQFYTTDRKLFQEDHALPNRWGCPKCFRQFESCRALSQHLSSTGH